jgi:hypothetical protein
VIFDPKAAKDTPLYWEYTNTKEDATSPVPPGFEVEVIDGSVKMTTSAAARRCHSSEVRPYDQPTR